jgi:Uma2 family endonuclease
MVAPMDTVLSDDTTAQPDVIYVRKENRAILKDRVCGVPDLVIEVLSPGTSRRDRLEKLDLYAKHGIAEYWIVDTESRLFEFFINDHGAFTMAMSPSVYQSSQFAEVQIDIVDFWKVINQRLPN